MADPIRLATWNVELARDGPGLLLQDILARDEDILSVVEVIARVSPDVILLTGFDYDLHGHALDALAERLAARGAAYPHRFARAPNAGLATGLDLDGDGRTGGPRDAQGYGTFAGEGGMALLSRLVIDAEASLDYSDFLWRDLPGALLDAEYRAVPTQRLSSVGHWDVALRTAAGETVRLWIWHATPPVFDGPEDRNGRRNHDEAAFWLRYLDGDLPVRSDGAPFVLLGDANLDPADGDGRPDALLALLRHPRVTDPLPGSAGGAEAASRDGGVNAVHRGDPAHDTADWPDGDGQPGNLRVDYVLPSVEWRVLDAGVWWPVDGEDAATAAAASRHRLVWVDAELP